MRYSYRVMIATEFVYRVSPWSELSGRAGKRHWHNNLGPFCVITWFNKSENYNSVLGFYLWIFNLQFIAREVLNQLIVCSLSLN